LLLVPPVVFGISSLTWVPLEVVVLAWVLISVTPSMRRVEMQSAVEVSCSPAAAFDLVSDPRNWRRYIPELEVVGPVDHPVHTGTVIRTRIHRGDTAPKAALPARSWAFACNETNNPAITAATNSLLITLSWICPGGKALQKCGGRKVTQGQLRRDRKLNQYARPLALPLSEPRPQCAIAVDTAQEIREL